MTDDRALTTYQSPHLMPAMSMADAVDRFKALGRFAHEIMRADVDYGTVPGTSAKPTLLKPGAEKLTTFFGLSVRFTLISKEEDWTGANHGGEPFFYYWFRCAQYRGEMLIAEADGSCNSWESKYRYRKADRACPVCKQTTIIKGRAEYGGGWLCFAKRGGCGTKFKDGDQAIEGQQTGRVINPDPADQVNTIQKMAQKRALVAATLLAVNASEYFTQDLEDLDPAIINGDVVDVQPVVRVEKPEPKPEPQPDAPKTNGKGWTQPELREAMEKLLIVANEATADHYKGTAHLFKAMRLERGKDFAWGNPHDEALWTGYLGTLVDHVQKEAGQKELPL